MCCKELFVYRCFISCTDSLLDVTILMQYIIHTMSNPLYLGYDGITVLTYLVVYTVFMFLRLVAFLSVVELVILVTYRRKKMMRE